MSSLCGELSLHSHGASNSDLIKMQQGSWPVSLSSPSSSAPLTCHEPHPPSYLCSCFTLWTRTHPLFLPHLISQPKNAVNLFVRVFLLLALLRKCDLEGFRNDLISSVQTIPYGGTTFVPVHMCFCIRDRQIPPFVLIITYQIHSSHPSDWFPCQHWPGILEYSFRWLKINGNMVTVCFV